MSKMCIRDSYKGGAERQRAAEHAADHKHRDAYHRANPDEGDAPPAALLVRQDLGHTLVAACGFGLNVPVLFHTISLSFFYP